jgi:hypothetical protein
MLKDNIFLTFALSPSHTTSEAARTQRSTPVNPRTSAIEEPESTGRASMAPPPLDTPPPEEVAEPPDLPSPEQIRAPVDAEGLLESSRGEALWHATWHKSPMSVRTLRGTAPLGEAHGCPPNLLDGRIENPIVLESGIVVPKARKPVLIEGEPARPDPGPARVLSRPNWTSIQGRQYCSRGSRT